MQEPKKFASITKPWREVTRTERLKIKKEQCIHCVFADLSRYGISNKSSADAITCDYISKKKHSRGCRPDACIKFMRQVAGRQKCNNQPIRLRKRSD